MPRALGAISSGHHQRLNTVRHVADANYVDEMFVVGEKGKREFVLISNETHNISISASPKGAMRLHG